MHLSGMPKKLKNAFSGLKNRLGKTALIWMAASVCIAALSVSIGLVAASRSSVVVYLNGEVVCKVDDGNTVNEALLLLQKINEEKGVIGDTDCSVTYRHKLSFLPTVSAEKCAEMIYEECEKDYSRGYVVSLEGIVIGSCATYGEAEKVVSEFYDYIVSSVLENDCNADLVKLTTDFKITSALCPKDNISSADDICRLVLNNADHYGSTDESTDGNKVVANGSLSLLYADKNFIFGMLKNEAEVVLPEFDFSFNLGELNSSIEYTTYVVEKYSEVIPYEVVYIETDELYIGEKRVHFAGENGIAENVYEIAYADGSEVSRKLVSSEVISEPQSRIEYIGTKEYPSTDPTGSFIWPIQKKFVITSYFGENREGFDEPGKAHGALDIAGVPVGTTIHAADGGTVVYAGELGTYGLLVRVMHENGVETYYAHCNKISVKVGDKVYKGQKVGEVGATGRVTGPHLHFEVRINGNKVNPLNYLPKAKPWQ